MPKFTKKPSPAIKEPAMKKYSGEAHSYDSNRPKRQVKSSYKGAAGAAY